MTTKLIAFWQIKIFSRWIKTTIWDQIITSNNHWIFAMCHWSFPSGFHIFLLLSTALWSRHYFTQFYRKGNWGRKPTQGHPADVESDSQPVSLGPKLMLFLFHFILTDNLRFPASFSQFEILEISRLEIWDTCSGICLVRTENDFFQSGMKLILSVQHRQTNIFVAHSSCFTFFLPAWISQVSTIIDLGQ